MYHNHSCNPLPNCLKDEDNIPIKDVIKSVNKELEEVNELISKLNLGKTEVKIDGVYRAFYDGKSVKIASGSFKKVRISNKKIKLF